MEPVRLACVRYLNTAPLIEGLEKVEGVTLMPAVPAMISGLVMSGGADMGLCSIVDCVGRAGSADPGLTLVPAGMIGCDGPTLTVRLFSALPFEEVTRLHADTDSHTSVVLAQLVLFRLFGIRVQVVPLDARAHTFAAPSAGAPDTVLLIGDKVVTDCPPTDRYPHQLDLGESWKGLTGLPFVYAMWMCRRGEEATPRVRHAAALLDRQRRHNALRLDWVIAQRAATSGWPTETARHYLADLLRYEVGPREKEAVEMFLGQAAEMRLVAERGVPWA